MQKSQRNLMMILPLLFITVVSHFPVGLILYWMTTNLWTVGQGLVTRQLVPRTPAGKGPPPAPAGPKRTSRTPLREAIGNGSESTAEEAKPKPAPPRQPRRVRKKKGGSRR